MLQRLSSSAEVRAYDAFVIAEAEVHEAGLQPAMNTGFRSVASYIFGGNSAGESIAMTSPVRAVEVSPGVQRISFVLPSKHRLDTLPVPKDTRVQLKPVAAHVAAAIEFTGGVREMDAVAAKTQELEALLRTNGLVTAGTPPILAEYYPPFAPGFMRKREVIIALKE